MKKWGCVLCSLLLTAPLYAQDSERARETLLRLHHEARVAHVLDDPRLLASGFADSVVQLNRGQVSVGTPEQAERRFAAYFDAVDFLEWEDIRPPRITLSPDGQWANVVVTKRVRLLARRNNAESHESTNFAWTALSRRHGEGWELLQVASTDEGEPADTVPVSARRKALDILTRSRKALGGDTAIARVAMVQFSANAVGPRRAFNVEVLSARDGRAVMRQRFSDSTVFELGVGLERSWLREGRENAPFDSLDAVQRGVLHGHEALLLAIAPEARFSNPRARDDAPFIGAPSEVVEFTDASGSAVLFFYDPQTHQPRGYRVSDAAGRADRAIDIRFDDWRRVGPVLLPHRVEFIEADGRIRYEISRATTEWIGDRHFRPN